MDTKTIIRVERIGNDCNISFNGTAQEVVAGVVGVLDGFIELMEQSGFEIEDKALLVQDLLAMRDSIMEDIKDEDIKDGGMH